MVAYSFKSRFAPRILDGTKTQTIRADRRRHARPGEIIQLYEAQRTPQCRLLMTPVCTAVLPIRLGIRNGVLAGVSIAALTLRTDELDEFAQADGFTDPADMGAFWAIERKVADLDWSGWLIKWRPDTIAPTTSNGDER